MPLSDKHFNMNIKSNMNFKMLCSLHNIIIMIKPSLCANSPINMSFFYHEGPPNSSSSKRCKFITSTLKDAFSNCHTFRGSQSHLEEDDPASNTDDEQEVVISEIRSKAMEAKSRRKASFTMDSFSWIFSPTTEEPAMIPKGCVNEEDAETDEYLSVKSCFSRCSSATSMEAFLSAKTRLSRCSSLSRLDYLQGLDDSAILDHFQDSRRRSIIREVCHCEGWPFGLCRRALLLPPLPKSPSDSWLWRKGARVVKLH